MFIYTNTNIYLKSSYERKKFLLLFISGITQKKDPTQPFPQLKLF